MSYKVEFSTVELILKSDAETRAVDSFTLALIKADRQVRKLFTFLVFQYPCFTNEDINDLRKILFKNKKIYFNNFISGFNKIYPKTIELFVGPEYSLLKAEIDKATKYRNKIFHGQLTSMNLQREDIIKCIENIMKWCE